MSAQNTNGADRVERDAGRRNGVINLTNGIENSPPSPRAADRRGPLLADLMTNPQYQTLRRAVDEMTGPSLTVDSMLEDMVLTETNGKDEMEEEEEKYVTSRDSCPPRYSEVSDETEVKEFYSDEEGSVELDGPSEKLTSDKETIMNEIKKLQEETARLREMQEAHARHLENLLQSQPDVNRKFTLIRKNSVTHPPSSLQARTVLEQRPGQSAFSNPLKKNLPQLNHMMDDEIYVQLEQLYCNFHILHFPTKTVQSVLGNNNKTDSYLYCDVGLEEASRKLARKEEENSKLNEENNALKERNKILNRVLNEKEEQLRKHRMPSPHCNRLDPYGSKIQTVAGRPTSPARMIVPPRDISPVEITFKWVIPDYSTKLQHEREIEGHREISSPIYLTHCGYRVQMETYLNGNSTGTNKCMSVFLRIIKGDYDRYLKWPVNLHLVVILVNQSGDNENSLKAGGNQFQFKQPCGREDSESDCWGLIEFVSHDMIRTRNYIKNNTIELKCRVQLLL